MNYIQSKSISQVHSFVIASTFTQSICIHYSCFENQGRFVTLKKKSGTLLFAKSRVPDFLKVPDPKKFQSDLLDWLGDWLIGWNGYGLVMGLVGQPSKGHPCRILIIFQHCSPIFISTIYQKIGDLFCLVHISGLSHSVLYLVLLTLILLCHICIKYLRVF